ncbi:DUF6074 family protein [Mesorhizobium australicum]|uniref:DUF6074 family protein n=1 Tax=Mesorhizobium australicum TaxID=536018 RepID=UPI00333C8AD4
MDKFGSGIGPVHLLSPYLRWPARLSQNACQRHLLARAGIPEDEQNEQLGAFWSEVQLEMIRLTCRGSQP